MPKSLRLMAKVLSTVMAEGEAGEAGEAGEEVMGKGEGEAETEAVEAAEPETEAPAGGVTVMVAGKVMDLVTPCRVRLPVTV